MARKRGVFFLGGVHTPIYTMMLGKLYPLDKPEMSKISKKVALQHLTILSTFLTTTVNTVYRLLFSSLKFKNEPFKQKRYKARIE